MRDQFTSENAGDFRQRYNGTFGWFLDGDKRVFVQLTRAGNKEVQFVDEIGWDFRVPVDSKYAFEFLPVTRGWFHVENSLYYLHRVPARQWRRGICEDNTSIRCVKLGPRAPTLLQVPFSASLLRKLFEEEVPFSESLNLLEKNNYAGLSRHFAIVGSCVFFQDVSIGRHKNRQIELDNPLILQELTDLIARNNYSLSFK